MRVALEGLLARFILEYRVCRSISRCINSIIHVHENVNRTCIQGQCRKLHRSSCTRVDSILQNFETINLNDSPSVTNESRSTPKDVMELKAVKEQTQDVIKVKGIESFSTPEVSTVYVYSFLVVIVGLWLKNLCKTS